MGPRASGTKAGLVLDAPALNAGPLREDRGPSLKTSQRSEGTVNLLECGRNDARDQAGDTDGYARAATPVTAAQVWKAWVRAARYWAAGR